AATAARSSCTTSGVARQPPCASAYASAATTSPFACSNDLMCLPAAMPRGSGEIRTGSILSSNYAHLARDPIKGPPANARAGMEEVPTRRGRAALDAPEDAVATVVADAHHSIPFDGDPVSGREQFAEPLRRPVRAEHDSQPFALNTCICIDDFFALEGL